MYQHESTWWLLIDTLWDTLLIETLQLWFCEAWRRVTPYDGPAWFQPDAPIIIFSFSPTLSILSLKWITLGLYSDSGKISRSHKCNHHTTPLPCGPEHKSRWKQAKKVGKKCPLLTPPHPWQTPYSKSLLRPHAVTYSIRPSPRTPGCHPEFIDKISPAISFCITSSTNLIFPIADPIRPGALKLGPKWGLWNDPQNMTISSWSICGHRPLWNMQNYSSQIPQRVSSLDIWESPLVVWAISTS